MSSSIINTPIDFVIAWVDGSDPEWQKEYNKYAPKDKQKDINSNCRYRDWDLLKYWFRGVEKFAPWVRKIHFLTWGHVPEWLDTTNPKIHVVNHRDYIPEEYLPTFSSHCIELNMHRIPDLAENFVYFNDDFYLVSQCPIDRFFRDGLPCDKAKPGAIIPTGQIALIDMNNMICINQKFLRDEVLAQHGDKWFSPLAGEVPEWERKCYCDKGLFFVGIKQYHMPQAYLKSTLTACWELWGKKLDETCRHKFRTSDDVNQWLFRDYQLVTGQFSPRSILDDNVFLNFYHKKLGKIREEILSGQYIVYVLNDCETSENEDTFEEDKTEIQNIFNTILPDCCSFEK